MSTASVAREPIVTIERPTAAESSPPRATCERSVNARVGRRSQPRVRLAQPTVTAEIDPTAHAAARPTAIILRRIGASSVVRDVLEMHWVGTAGELQTPVEVVSGERPLPGIRDVLVMPHAVGADSDPVVLPEGVP